MMPPEQAQEQESTSMREDFEKSISAIESDDEGAITTETAADEAEITAASVNDDEEGKKSEAEAKTEAEAAKIIAEKADTEDKPDDDAGKIGGDLQADAGKSDELTAAPESWQPAAREGWKDLPEPVREQINKRETQINKALNDGAEHRKTGEKFQGIADRYAQVIAAEGAPDALTGVEELVKTVATLRMGSPEQKAQKIAGFIQHYGVSVEMLDGILSGKIGGSAAQPNIDPNIAALLDERMKPVNELLTRMDETTRQQNFTANQNAINEVATFKQDHEFYADVQDDMADMVELAGKRGIVMPLQDAYDKACALSPEISGVLTKRATAARLLNGKQSLEEKKEAASSIMGRQGGEPAKDGKGMSMRDTLTEAYDSQTG